MAVVQEVPADRAGGGEDGHGVGFHRLPLYPVPNAHNIVEDPCLGCLVLFVWSWISPLVFLTVLFLPVFRPCAFSARVIINLDLYWFLACCSSFPLPLLLRSV